MFRQSGPSRFNRLHQILAGEHGLDTLTIADDTIWNGLEIGESIEVLVNLVVPEFLQSIDQVSNLAAMAPLLDAFSDIAALGIPGVDASNEDLKNVSDIKRAMPALQNLTGAVADAPLPIIMRLADAPRYVFFTFLDRQMLKVAPSELEGEARALLKVDRHNKRGRLEKVELMPGMPQQNRAQRRAAGTDDSPALTLKAPAARVSCVAIYR